MNPYHNLVRMTYGAPLTLGAPLPQELSETSPKRFPVLLQKGKRLGGKDKFYYGHVVTYLDLVDWCQMKGYQLFFSYPSIRHAKKSERTNLTSL